MGGQLGDAKLAHDFRRSKFCPGTIPETWLWNTQADGKVFMRLENTTLVHGLLLDKADRCGPSTHKEIVAIVIVTG